MTCRCRHGQLCTCSVITDRATAGDYVLAALCAAVFLGAVALLVFP